MVAYPQGMRLRELREAAGLSRSALAAVVMRTPLTIARWESGAHRPPGNVLVALAKVLEVPLSAIK